MGKAITHHGLQIGTRESARMLHAPRSENALPEEALMSARRFAIVLCVVTFSATFAWSADEIETSVLAAEVAVSSSSPGKTTDITPWIHPSMPSAVQKKLTVAFEIAVQRVEEVPQCEALFTKLGADAFETLKTGLYFPATPARETNACKRSYAQTFVGDAPTWICRRITGYSDEQAAMVVIHEALHHAGLPEKPHDRKAMTSAQINDMVRANCRL
jgi:hypothetical protein